MFARGPEEEGYIDTTLRDTQVASEMGNTGTDMTRRNARRIKMVSSNMGVHLVVARTSLVDLVVVVEIAWVIGKMVSGSLLVTSVAKKGTSALSVLLR